MNHLQSVSWAVFAFDFIRRQQMEAENLIDYKMLLVCIVLSTAGSLFRQADQSSIERISNEESRAIIVGGLVMGLLSFLVAVEYSKGYPFAGFISCILSFYSIDIFRNIRIGLPLLIKRIMDNLPNLLIAILKSKTGTHEESNNDNDTTD